MADKLTNQQEWPTYMPPTEVPILSGQKRFAFVDGFGEVEVEIVSWTNEQVLVKSDIAADGLMELDWELIGIIVGGVEDQKLQAELEKEALSTPAAE